MLLNAFPSFAFFNSSLYSEFDVIGHKKLIPALEMSRNVQSGNTQNLKSSVALVRLPSAPAPTPGTSQAAVPAGCAYRP